MKHIVVIAAAVALAACGPIQRAQMQAQQQQLLAKQQQWRSETLAYTNQIRLACDERTEDAGFDSIRNKVELCKIGLDRQKTTPFQFLAIDTTPTATEKQAIGDWAAVRDELNAQLQA